MTDPNTPGAGAPPAESKALKGYFYGRRGKYASHLPERQATGKGLSFGDRVEFTDKAFAALPSALKDHLVPEAKWPAYIKALKKDGQLKATAAVPGVEN